MEPVAEVAPAAPPRPACETDWGAFVDAYGRAVLDWLREAGPSSAEADALALELLRLIGREFAQVAGDPEVRFRAWLQYAGHAAWCKLMEANVADEGEKQSPALTLLLSVEAHDLFLKALDDECGLWRRRAALPRAAEQTDPNDWEAFYLAVLEGRPAAEVAAELQSPELAVHAAAYRVGKLLRQELQKYEEHC